MPKQPKVKQSPVVGKRPSAAREGGFHHLRPAWRVSLLETVAPFGWHEVSREKILEIREKLANFETMTCGEILVQAAHAHHIISVSDIAREAQQRLQAIGQDDVDELISLRLTGRERVWGILEGNILKVLWWDPEHQVLPVERR